MFAEVELARRIERAEVSLTSELVGQVPERRAIVMAIDAGVAAFARPGSPMNKLIGVGLDGPVDAAGLAAIEAAFDERGEPVRVELSTLAAPEALAALVDRGYALRGFENVLGLRLDEASVKRAATAAVEIEAVTPATEPAWGRTAVDGFAAPDGTGVVLDENTRDAIEEVMADFVRVRGMRRYLARLGGDLAGAAAARHAAGVVQLCGATTLPPFRRRGVQRALLDARLADGPAAGCDLAVVTTAPGSQSQANVMRRGFALLYARAILIRPVPTPPR